MTLEPLLWFHCPISGRFLLAYIIGTQSYGLTSVQARNLGPTALWLAWPSQASPHSVLFRVEHGSKRALRHVYRGTSLKETAPPRTLQCDCAYGPTAALEGKRFLMSEVPL